MTRIGWGLLAALLIGGAAIAYRMAEARPARPLAERPPLARVTSLPLVFGEQFAIEAVGSPALDRIEQRYRVEPIGVADAASLKGHQLLLMAHPRAQPAEVLVELDAWVRGGGRAVLLADPKLEWEGSRPLGDPLRPPPYFADTGLLGHWGLALDLGEQGRGHLRALDRRCAIAQAGLVARCAIGRGRVTVIADADFVISEDDADKRIEPLIDELARVEPR